MLSPNYVQKLTRISMSQNKSFHIWWRSQNSDRIKKYYWVGTVNEEGCRPYHRDTLFSRLIFFSIYFRNGLEFNNIYRIGRCSAMYRYVSICIPVYIYTDDVSVCWQDKITRKQTTGDHITASFLKWNLRPKQKSLSAQLIALSNLNNAPCLGRADKHAHLRGALTHSN